MKQTRAKNKNGDWVIITEINILKHHIIICEGNFCDVKLETVCFPTRIRDYKNRKIYEGDIVRINGKINAEVEFDEELGYVFSFNSEGKINKEIIDKYFPAELEIIGDIYDNFVEGGKQ